MAFGLKDSLTLIQNAGLGEISQVRASGGGTKSPLWRQILASVLEAELVTVNTTEGAAYGAALLAAVGAGMFPSVDATCETAITVTGRTSPDEKQGEAYRQGYAVYQELYPGLKASFGKLGSLQHGPTSTARPVHHQASVQRGRLYLNGAAFAGPPRASQTPGSEYRVCGVNNLEDVLGQVRPWDADGVSAIPDSIDPFADVATTSNLRSNRGKAKNLLRFGEIRSKMQSVARMAARKKSANLKELNKKAPKSALCFQNRPRGAHKVCTPIFT
jgi:hypothetical protein